MSAVLEEDYDIEIEHSGVNGNPLLKPAGTQIEWQPWQIEEYLKCKEDPIYFCEKYVKIISLDEGVINFKMFDFQKRFVRVRLSEAIRSSSKSKSLYDRSLRSPDG